MSDLTRRSNEEPLMDVPTELRKPCLMFFNFYSDLLKGTLGLATRVSTWLAADEMGISATDIHAAMKELLHPRKAANYQYAGQLFAAFSEIVFDKATTRRSHEKTERLRNPPDRPMTDYEAVKQKLAEGMKPPTPEK